MFSTKKKTKERTPTVFDLGICNGKLPGQIGIWGVWNEPLELLKVTLEVSSEHGRLGPYSFTFSPAPNSSFFQSLQVPQKILELMRGTRRATQGTIHMGFLFADGNAGSQDYKLAFFCNCVHGRGNRPPKGAVLQPATLDVDDKAIADLSLLDLKRKSDEIRRQLEEKRQKEEEARKAKEAAGLEAKARAEAAKAKGTEGAATTIAKPTGPTLSPCKVALIFGSSTGNTESVADMIKKELGGKLELVKNVKDITAHDFAIPEALILGVPTWHIGEMQDDWAVLLPEIDKVNPSVEGKKVALFGLGDGKGYPDTYVDAMQELWEKFETRGAKLVGLWPTDGYIFQKSKAILKGKFLGLVIDVENQDALTAGRVKSWVSQIRNELSL